MGYSYAIRQDPISWAISTVVQGVEIDDQDPGWMSQAALHLHGYRNSVQEGGAPIDEAGRSPSVLYSPNIRAMAFTYVRC